MAPEGQCTEWKEAWRDDLLRWICGFANAEGGTLIIGRDDSGRPVGAPDAHRLLVDLPNKIRDSLGIVVPVRAVQEGGHTLVEIEVEASPTPISYRGEYHIRSGSAKLQLTGNALSMFLLKRFGKHWDGEPMPGVSVDELDPLAFRRFRSYARARKRVPEDALATSDMELVEKLHLFEGGWLKRAACLLFDERPDRRFTGAYIKIGMFRTEAQILFQDEVRGDLFTQMEKTLDLLFTKYMAAFITFEGVQRVETFPIPLEAMREALLNALIHKDYASGNPIQIKVFPERLILWNDGPLPTGWTAETLLTSHRSVPRNPDVAGVVFRSGLVEAWGRGYQHIVDECRKVGGTIPALLVDAGGVGMAWRWGTQSRARNASHRPQPGSELESELESQLGSELESGVELESELELQLGSELESGVELESQLESELESGVELESELESRIIAALADGPLGKAELAKAFGQRQPSGPLHAAIRRLVAQGTLEQTLPTRPNSRLQKYRLTATGHVRLKPKQPSP